MNEHKLWLNEYEKFLQAEDTAVPKETSNQVLSRLLDLVNPSAWSVFVKVLCIQSVVGFLSMSVCHQFGMNPFGTEFSLDRWFMEMWGHNICMVGCGVLFLSAGVITACSFLSIEEVRTLRRHQLLQNFLFAVISLGIFMACGVEMAITLSGLWILGGFIGGFLATEAMWKLRRA